MGLRLRAADDADAVHGQLLRGLDRGPPDAPLAATLLEERRPGGDLSREARAFPLRRPPATRSSSGFLEPLARRWARRFYDLHALQEGRLTIYLVYVLGTLVALLSWSVVRGWFPPR